MIRKCNNIIYNFQKFLFFYSVFSLKLLCIQYNFCFIRKSRRKEKNTKQLNGSTDTASQSNSKQGNVTSQNGKTSDSEGEETAHNSNVQKKKKKKSKQKEKQLLKKEARELRAQAMSKDIELFKFSNVNLSKADINDMEIVQNGNTHSNSTNSKSLSKRNHEKIVEENHEPKKRRKSTSSI